MLHDLKLVELATHLQGLAWIARANRIARRWGRCGVDAQSGQPGVEVRYQSCHQVGRSSRPCSVIARDRIPLRAALMATVAN